MSNKISEIMTRCYVVGRVHQCWSEHTYNHCQLVNVFHLPCRHSRNTLTILLLLGECSALWASEASYSYSITVDFSFSATSLVLGCHSCKPELDDEVVVTYENQNLTPWPYVTYIHTYIHIEKISHRLTSVGLASLAQLFPWIKSKKLSQYIEG